MRVFGQVNHASGSVYDDVFSEEVVVLHISAVEAVHTRTGGNPNETFLVFDNGENALVAQPFLSGEILIGKRMAVYLL